MKTYLKLLRVNHYIKNLLIFLPLIFSGNFFNIPMLKITILSFISFCLMASAIYIFNDLLDYEKDRLHPKKKYRPIASDKISKTQAKIIFTVLIILSLLIELSLYWFGKISLNTLIISISLLLLYLIINIFYSILGKHIPILDILLLSFGFILRVFFGGSVTQVTISSWLYLTILSFSLYLVLGKRKGELEKNKDFQRKVLKYYTVPYLEKFMNIYLALTLAFYSLWCATNTIVDNNLLIYSIFFIIFIVMKYSLNIENTQNEYMGDPVEVVLHDKILLLGILLYAIYMGGILYGKYLGL